MPHSSQKAVSAKRQGGYSVWVFVGANGTLPVRKLPIPNQARPIGIPEDTKKRHRTEYPLDAIQPREG